MWPDLFNGTDMTDMSNYTVTGGNAESNRKGLLLATTILMSDKTGTKIRILLSSYLICSLRPVEVGSVLVRLLESLEGGLSWGRGWGPGPRVGGFLSGSTPPCWCALRSSSPGLQHVRQWDIVWWLAAIVSQIIERILGNKCQCQQVRDLTLHSYELYGTTKLTFRRRLELLRLLFPLPFPRFEEAAEGVQSRFSRNWWGSWSQASRNSISFFT